jgi:hypothetical protein
MRQVCSAPFSAAQHPFAPEVLDRVVRSLAQQALGQGQGGDVRTRQALAALTAVDGTLLRAVPRMTWTPAAGPAWAARLHLHFSVFDQVPEAWTITPGTVPDFRVVRVEAHGDVFQLITTREDLSAELIGLIYRQRWQIELFFKWIKTILNCRHWLAESPAGVTIQIYCVLIAALLLLLWTGRRPNKRAVESLRLYWLGWATEQELAKLLQRATAPKKS